jgi:branched-chain amino acid transport system permease protein
MIIQQLVNGLTLGAAYTLVALAFSLVMGVLGILNLAVAELFMIGAYVGLTVLVAGYSIPVALLAAMVTAAALSFAIEKIAYEPLRNSPLVTPMLSTVGVSIILQNVATNIWGSDPYQLPDEYLGSRIDFGLFAIGEMQILVIGAAVVLVALLGFVVERTKVGRALRAVAENRDVARLLGVSATRLTLVAFLISGALAGAAGLLIALHYAAVTPYIGVETGLKAIAVMVVGGVTRIWGALLAGPLIGMAEVLTVAYGGAALRDFIVYGFMIVILLVRPGGLLSQRGGGEGQRS